MGPRLARSEDGSMTERTYYVRDGAPGPGALGTAAAGAYLAAGRDGPRFPYWTWQKPDPLPLQQAEALRQAAVRMGCRTLRLQPADDRSGPADGHHG
jgi:hypothetical protein